jgi:hypothetical protein
VSAHLADIHLRDAASEDHADRLLQLERDPQVLREVIQRSQRKHAERDVGARERLGHGADRAVTTTRDYRLRTTSCRLTRKRAEPLARLDELHPCLAAGLAEEAFDRPRRIRRRPAPGRRVEEDDDRH